MLKAGFAICETTAVGGESVRAYGPPPLPPLPPLRPDRLYGVLEVANQALGRLDGVRSIVPDTPLFLYMYVRKEALLSSQIEGTQSCLSDRLLFESDEVPGVPLDDVEEVSNYVAVMTTGLARMREGFPLSTRLLREFHAVLLSGGRVSEQQPGEFRRSQIWPGGSPCCGQCPGFVRPHRPQVHRAPARPGDSERAQSTQAGSPVRLP